MRAPYILIKDCCQAMKLSQNCLHFFQAPTKTCCVDCRSESTGTLLDIEQVGYLAIGKIQGGSGRGKPESSEQVMKNKFLGLICFHLKDIFSPRTPYINSYKKALCNCSSPPKQIFFSKKEKTEKKTGRKAKEAHKCKVMWFEPPIVFSEEGRTLP